MIEIDYRGITFSDFYLLLEGDDLRREFLIAFANRRTFSLLDVFNWLLDNQNRFSHRSFALSVRSLLSFVAGEFPSLKEFFSDLCLIAVENDAGFDKLIAKLEQFISQFQGICANIFIRGQGVHYERKYGKERRRRSRRAEGC